MSDDAYLDHLAAEGRGLLVAAGGNLAAVVPACPGWTLADLVLHTGRVFARVAGIVSSGATTRPPASVREPEPEPDLLAWFERQLDAVHGELASAEPTRQVWTRFPGDQSVGFWRRRLALEALVHRVDAELAAQARHGPIDEELALDGIDEVLEVYLLPGAERVPPGARGGAGVVIESAGRRWWVRIGEGDADLRRDGSHGEERGGEGSRQAGARAAAWPRAAVRAGAPELLLWLWGRAGDESVALGDASAARRLREALAAVT